MNRINEALVKIWGMNAGIISWDGRRRLASFQYSEEFRNSGLEISPMKFTNSRNSVPTNCLLLSSACPEFSPIHCRKNTETP